MNANTAVISFRLEHFQILRHGFPIMSLSQIYMKPAVI